MTENQAPKTSQKQAAMALDCALPVALYAFAKVAGDLDVPALFGSLRERLKAQGFVTEAEIDAFLEPLRENVDQMRELVGPRARGGKKEK